MSNDTQVLDRNPVSSLVSNSVVQLQGSLNKEVPIATGLSEIMPAGPEVSHKIDQESAELGVKEVQDRPDLKPEHIELGVSHSGPNVIIPPGPTGLVQIPEKKDTSESNTWLNALTEKVRKVMRLMGF